MFETYFVYIDFPSGYDVKIEGFSHLSDAINQADVIQHKSGISIHCSVYASGKCFYSTDKTVEIDGR